MFLDQFKIFHFKYLNYSNKILKFQFLKTLYLINTFYYKIFQIISKTKHSLKICYSYTLHNYLLTKGN